MKTPSPNPREPTSERMFSSIRSQLAELPGYEKGDTLLVALSGGLDSLVLLHLLRFGAGDEELSVHVAHLDHRMREGSREDALWVKGLCQAWEVGCTTGFANPAPRSEDEAREARYEFLLRVRDEVGAPWILTAHHGDDQAETVLFRIFRGTGLKGLAGIPQTRPPGIFRPLLPFARSELEEYARCVGIRPRQDPSNQCLSIPRNYLRHRILPQAEKDVAPGAGAALRRLARLAEENEIAWASLLPTLLEGVAKESVRGISVVRSAFLTYHPSVRSRLLREVFRQGGLVLDEAGTIGVLEFTRNGASGRSLMLPGGFRFSREFDRFFFEEESGSGGNTPLTILGPEEGSGAVELGGSRFMVKWGDREALDFPLSLSLPLASVDFPLRVRGRLPGDRIALPYGAKKLKKLMAESGIGVAMRDRMPILVDASDQVLWVPGLAVGALGRTKYEGAQFHFGIKDVEES